jgi:hypothetical protein
VVTTTSFRALVLLMSIISSKQIKQAIRIGDFQHMKRLPTFIMDKSTINFGKFIMQQLILKELLLKKVD